MANLAGWQYRKKLTVDKDEIDATLSDFTVRVILDNTNFDFSKAKSDGTDIRFTASDGTTLLKYERIVHDDTGEFAMYEVKVSSVSSSVDTDFYLYYGNADASDGEDATNAWDGNFIAVYHMNDLTTSSIKDSTGNYNGTKASANNPQEVNGLNYKAQDFSADYIDLNDIDINGNGTIEALVNPDSFGGSFPNHVVSKGAVGGAGATKDISLQIENATGKLRLQVGDTSSVQTFLSTLVASTGSYQYIASRVDGTNLALFLDTTKQTTAQTVTPAGDNSDYSMGRPGEYPGAYYDGKIGEVRISDTDRSDAWMKATRQSLFDNLLTFGDEEGLLIEFDETITIDDSWSLFVPAQEIDFSETIEISDSWVFSLQTDYATKIISYNPLIYVTLTDPAYIVQIDISDPANPSKTVYTLTGVKNARDVVLNDTNDYFYVICDEGKVVKIAKANLNTQTIIDTGDSDTLEKVDSLDSHLRTFVSTDDSDGEIIVIDEATIKKINIDLRWRQQITNIISTRLNTILGKLLNLDLRWKAEVSKVINTDLRWLKYTYATTSQYPINRTSDWKVKINGTDLIPLEDVQMDSIQITHDITAEKTKGSQATFVLNRRHDKLDYDNQGNASQITNQNAVIIEIQGTEEFSGKINRLDCDSETETVTVTALGERPTDKRHTVNIPIASVNENIHLYQCLIHNPHIDNPYIDSRLVIQGDDENYWTGSAWNSDVSNALTFGTWTDAENYIDGVAEGNTLFHDNVPEVTNYDAQPEYYKGVSIELGTQIEQNILRYSSLANTTSIAESIQDGTFKPKQNWSYFWLVRFTHLILGLTQATLNYIGKTLGSMSTDAWQMDGVAYKYQKILDDIETDLGSYQVGSAPYNIISVQNGQKIVKDKWEDKKDGLYLVRDEGYNYEQYAKDIADLEYSKLQNINGVVLPVASAEIEISIDGYYYYNIALLTRINVTNTTTSNIYKNNNGFPLSVKTITISSATMKTTLGCSNQKSIVELNEIDEDYPDKNSDQYLFPEKATKIHSKFDPTTWGYPA
ncbi:MAG: DUF2341 domain-containing protein [Candidatus Thorarchaeota archaeon]|jgi:hypothetical protein